MGNTFSIDRSFGEAAQNVVEKHWLEEIRDIYKGQICLPIKRPATYMGKEVKSAKDLPAKFRPDEIKWHFKGGADTEYFTENGIFPLEVKAERGGTLLSRNNNGISHGDTTAEPTIGIELWSYSDKSHGLIGNGWLHAYLFPEEHQKERGVPQTTPHWIAFAGCPGDDGNDVFCYIIFRWEDLKTRLIELSNGMISPEWKLDFKQYRGKPIPEIKRGLPGMAFVPQNMWHVPLSELENIGEIFWVRDLTDDELTQIAKLQAKQRYETKNLEAVEERVQRRYRYLKQHASNILPE